MKHFKSALQSLAVLVASAVVYAAYGFEGFLSRDAAVVLYSGQRMAAGVPPYVSLFDNKSPLSSLLAGLAATVAEYLSWDDVHVVRGFFFLMSCCTALAVFHLTRRIFRSDRAAWYAAGCFVGFLAFSRSATCGPNAKTPMVLAQTLSLVFLCQRRWFWAALCGSLAGLAWQPMIVFPLAAVALAAMSPAGGRLRACCAAIAGTVTPIALVTVYFYARGALDDLIDGAVLFNIRYMHRGEPLSVLDHIYKPMRAILHGFSVELVPIAIGFAAMAYLYVWRVTHHRSLIRALARDERFSPILLTFPAPVAWSLLDFQWSADFFVFLPYLAVLFGWFASSCTGGMARATEAKGRSAAGGFLTVVVGLALFICAWMGVRFARETGLREQVQTARAVEERFGKDARFASIGAPEFLVVLHRANPNRYAFITDGIDNRIDVRTEGGFDQWARDLADWAPDVVAFGPTWGTRTDALVDWLNRDYCEEFIGPWHLFVKPEAAGVGE